MPTPTALPQHAGGYNTLAVHAIERVWNKSSIEDLVFKATPLLEFFKAMDGGRGNIIQKENYGHELVVRILAEKAQGGGTFRYYSNLNSVGSKLGTAARFLMSNYYQPLMMSWEEEKELNTPEAYADAYETYINSAIQTQSELIAEDLYGGNALDDQKLLGLEQICSPVAHLQSSGSAATNVNQRISYDAQVRQQTDVYGGITRSAWSVSSGVETPGSGWESNVFSYDGLTVTGGRLGYSSGIPSEGTKRLHEMYYKCGQGSGNLPNFLVMTPEPYGDYEFGGHEKLQIRRTGSEYGDLNLSFDHLQFKNAIVIRDERARSKRTTGVQTIGDENIYLGNTNVLTLCVDTEADHSLVGPFFPPNQLAAVMYMLWRGQLKCRNPRYMGRMSDYQGT